MIGAGNLDVFCPRMCISQIAPRAGSDWNELIPRTMKYQSGRLDGSLADDEQSIWYIAFINPGWKPGHRCCLQLNSRQPFQEGCVIAPAWRALYTYKTPSAPVRIHVERRFFVRLQTLAAQGSSLIDDKGANKVSDAEVGPDRWRQT